MLKVELLNYEDLSKDEQEIVPSNGHGKEYANYVKVTDGGEVISLLSDAVQPEDATYRRDFGEVIGVIEEAYRRGITAGRRLGGDR